MEEKSNGVNIIKGIYPLIKPELSEILNNVKLKVEDIKESDGFLNHDNKLTYMMESIQGSITKDMSEMFKVTKPLKTWISLTNEYSLPLYMFYQEAAEEISDFIFTNHILKPSIFL